MKDEKQTDKQKDVVLPSEAKQQEAAPVAAVKKEQTPKDVVYACEAKFKEIIKESNLELNFLKESGFALQAIANNPFLLKCSVPSLQQAVVNIALSGLTLNPKLGYCALVPRGGKVVLDIQYQGLLFIMTNQLNVKAVHADVIYKNDLFDYFVDQKGTQILHRPDKFNERGEILGAYAVAYLQNGSTVAVVLNNAEIDEIKATSQAASAGFSPWNGTETIKNEMRKKTAIRRLWKMVPKTDRISELMEAVSIDDENSEPKFKLPKEKANFDAISFEDHTEEITE